MGIMVYRLLCTTSAIFLLMTQVVYAADGYTVVFGEDVAALTVGEHNSVTVRAHEARSLTTCFELESSGAGQFYSSSKVLIGDKIKSNIPKNENGASNRNFFYTPSVEGEETFTLKTFLRPESVSTSCDTWTPEGDAWAVYETTVTVGAGGGVGEEGEDEESEDNDTPDDTSTTTPETTTPESTSVSSSSGSGSAHSSSAVLSTAKTTVTFEVSAGRPRTAMVGSLVQFDAAVTKGGEFSQVHFRWSFGDGTDYAGQSVSHAYALPGTYEVVLNAGAGNQVAVARTRVVVSAPRVALEEVDPVSGYAMFRNYDSREVNVGGWEVKADDSKFIFPQDTLITSGGRLPVAFATMNLPVGSTTTTFVVRDPQGKELLTYGGASTTTAVAASVAQLEEQLAVLTTTVERLAVANVPVESVPTLPLPNRAEVVTSVASSTDSTEVTTLNTVQLESSTTSTNTVQVAAVGAVTIVVPPARSWYAPVLGIPRLGLDLLRGILP